MAGIMLQPANPLSGSTSTPDGHQLMSGLFHFQSSGLHVAWESCRGWPISLGSYFHVEDLEEANDPQLQISFTGPPETTRGVNQHMEERPLCVKKIENLSFANKVPKWLQQLGLS